MKLVPIIIRTSFNLRASLSSRCTCVLKMNLKFGKESGRGGRIRAYSIELGSGKIDDAYCVSAFR